jgi:hypothetical protein
VSGADNYKITVQVLSLNTGFEQWNTLPEYDNHTVNNTECTLEDLEHSKKYRYWIVSVLNDDISENSNTIFSITLPKPTQTTEAVNITSTSFTATWERVSWASSYILKVSRDFDQQIIIPAEEVNDTSYTITGLEPNNGYRYAVKVVSPPEILMGIPEQESELSNWTLVETSPELETPVAIEASNISDSSFTANWEPVANAQNYLLYVLKQDVNDPLVWILVPEYDMLNVAETYYEVTGLDPESEYKYYVVAENGEDRSTSSNAIIVSTLTAPQNFTVTLSCLPNNAGTLTGSGMYTEGTLVNISAVAASGYTFTHWTENDQEISADAQYSFNIDRNMDIIAHFELLNSIPDIDAQNIEIYPNPVHRELSVEGVPNKSIISIISLSGKKVLRQEYIEKNQQVLLPEIAPGVYIINIETPEARTKFSKRIIVE